MSFVRSSPQDDVEAFFCMMHDNQQSRLLNVSEKPHYDDCSAIISETLFLSGCFY